MKTRYLQFVAQGRSIQIGLNLNPEQPNHRFVSQHLDAGFFYEPDVSLFLTKSVRAADICVDVGANLGFHSMLMAGLVGPTGKVLCFEPDQKNLNDLHANTLTNSYTDRVEVIPKVVKNRQGETEFYIHDLDSGGNALWDPTKWPGNGSAKTSQKIKIEATTLDREVLCRDLRAPIRVLKIDTEGAEHTVLQGAETLLKAGLVEYIVCELHEFGLNQMRSSQDELRSYVLQFGYETFVLGHKGTLPRFCPTGIRIRTPGISNLLFAKASALAQIYTEADFQIRDY
ncbi:FkbM family methyltransferase [Gammaproteobacteria bacterium]